jgi:transcriptional regulator with XRE-family HTH domain
LTRPAGGTRTGGGLGGHQPRGGVITGYLFKLIRESLGLTQEGLADRLGLDKNTVQGWESGRRSLASTRVGDLLRLRHQLCVLGADGRLLDAIDTAMEADYLLAHALAVEPEDVQPEAHPLAAMVNTGLLVDMLTWPFTERAPVLLRDLAHAPRRGPVASAPSLATGEKDRFYRHLRAAAERSTVGRSGFQVNRVLLRRQVYYLVALDQRPEASAWLSDMERVEQRHAGRLDGWSPAWVGARSLAVSRSRQGDREPLRYFIEVGLRSDECEAANLNYWAYWAGETTGTHHADTFMATGDLGPWRGTTLLRRLSENLLAADPYVDLCVHSVWALLERRAQILEDDLALACSLGELAQVLLDQGDISARARKELEQVHFLVRAMRPMIGTRARTKDQADG